MCAETSDMEQGGHCHRDITLTQVVPPQPHLGIVCHRAVRVDRTFWQSGCPGCVRDQGGILGSRVSGLDLLAAMMIDKRSPCDGAWAFNAPAARQHRQNLVQPIEL